MLKKLFGIIFCLILIVVLAGAMLLKVSQPLIEEWLLQKARSSLAGDLEISELEIKPFKARASFRGFSLKDPPFIKYSGSLSADEIVISLDPIASFVSYVTLGNFRIEKIFIDGLELKVKNLERPDKQKEDRSGRAGETARSPDKSDPICFNDLSIETIDVKDAVLVFEDYSVERPPHIIKLVAINGRISRIEFPLMEKDKFNCGVDLEGKVNSEHQGRFKISGDVLRDSNGIDFDLDIDMGNIDLVNFSPYYSRTSFTILNEARVDLRSEAVCSDDRLNAVQKVRIYDIKLNDIKPENQDMLFKLPAKTVVDFFNNNKGEVEFRFNLVGTITDPKFDPGPIVKDLLSNALRQKIMNKIGDFPNELMKMGEKAFKDGFEEEDIEKIDKEIDKVKNELKKIIDF